MLLRLFRLTLLAALWLCTLSSSYAQLASKLLPTAGELKKNLAIIESSTEGESEAIDQLLAKTSRDLVTYLSTHELSAAAAKDLGLELSVDSKDAAHVKVYTYSYYSGGTRGTIHRPIFQWKNAAGKLFAYHSHEECSFYKIHQLAVPNRSLYLLIGMEKGDSQCDVSEAYVVELKGNYLLLGEAFGKKPDLSLCNVDMTFEAGKQQLTVDLTEYEDRRREGGAVYDQQYLAQHGYHYKRGAKRLLFQFRDGRFVQLQ